MAFVGVAQVVVLNDDHVSIADFFEGTKAQVVDSELSYHQTTATTTKDKIVEQEEEKKKKERFYDSLE